jgi:hypothetical protein
MMTTLDDPREFVSSITALCNKYKIKLTATFQHIPDNEEVICVYYPELLRIESVTVRKEPHV